MGTVHIQNQIAVASWRSLLNDQATLLDRPGAHHKLLADSARELHKLEIVERDELCEMLELADAALEYAIEANLYAEAG